MSVKVAKFTVKFRVFVVFTFENSVFDAESIEGVFSERMFGDLWGPAAEIFTIEERDPIRGLEREEKCGCEEERAGHEAKHVILV